MKDARALLDSLMKSGGEMAAKAKETWNDQSVGTKGALAGGLLGVLFGGGRGGLGSVARVGGMAAIGSLASKAFADWQAGKAAQAAAEGDLPPADPKFLSDDSDAADEQATRLLQAMVAAAKADGRVTEEERARITGQMDALGLNAEAAEMLNAEFAAPLDIDRVAALARSPEEAAAIYAASLMVVDAEGAAEQGYLADLAGKLQLDAGLVAHLKAGTARLA
jgi:uncharacterized membrane protein YebE (DUF533 family)